MDCIVASGCIHTRNYANLCDYNVIHNYVNISHNSSRLKSRRCESSFMDLRTVHTTLFRNQSSLHLRHVTSHTVRTDLLPSVGLVRVDGAFPTNVTVSTEPSSTGHCNESIEFPITSNYRQIWRPN